MLPARCLMSSDDRPRPLASKLLGTRNQCNQNLDAPTRHRSGHNTITRTGRAHCSPKHQIDGRGTSTATQTTKPKPPSCFSTNTYARTTPTGTPSPLIAASPGRDVHFASPAPLNAVGAAKTNGHLAHQRDDAARSQESARPTSEDNTVLYRRSGSARQPAPSTWTTAASEPNREAESTRNAIPRTGLARTPARTRLTPPRPIHPHPAQNKSPRLTTQAPKLPGLPGPRLNLNLVLVLVLVLEQAGRIDEAIDMYATALEVYPNHLPSTQALARAQLRYNRADATTKDHLDEIALRGDDRWRNWARLQLAKVR